MDYLAFFKDVYIITYETSALSNTDLSNKHFTIFPSALFKVKVFSASTVSVLLLPI